MSRIAKIPCLGDRETEEDAGWSFYSASRFFVYTKNNSQCSVPRGLLLSLSVQSAA